MFLKNRNISSKIKRSKVTDYAALNGNVHGCVFAKNSPVSLNWSDYNQTEKYKAYSNYYFRQKEEDRFPGRYRSSGTVSRIPYLNK